MEKAPRSSFTEKADSHWRLRAGAALLLILIAAVFILPGSVEKFVMLEKAVMNAVSGEDIAELGRREIEKSLAERHYWGGMVAAVNPSLTSFEVNEIGRAIIRYSGQYGLSPRLIVAIIMVESNGRVHAESPKGAQGLMQVMPFWKSELGIKGTLFDIDNNIRAGTHILAENIKARGFEDGIALYYRGNLPVSGASYLGKVQKAMQSIS
jgi:hypothetical protein